MSKPYRLKTASPAAKALTEQLPEKVAHAAYAFITGPLLDEPHRVGKPLAAPLAPAWTARRGSYRILYLVDDDRHEVEVTAARRLPLLMMVRADSSPAHPDPIERLRAEGRIDPAKKCVAP